MNSFNRKFEYKKRFKKAKQTEKLTRTFVNYALGKLKYNSMFLISKRGFESTGIVDVIAARKNGDKTEIVFIQSKGGNAKVTAGELKRLHNVINQTVLKIGIMEYTQGLPKLKIIEEYKLNGLRKRRPTA